MIEILYRIYEKGETYYDNYIETMDAVICENRDHFKEIIRETYGEQMRFRNDKNVKIGEKFCIIIGELTYGQDSYFSLKTYTCGYCGSTIKTFNNYAYLIEGLENKRFCCRNCKETYIATKKQEFLTEEELILTKYVDKYQKDDYTASISGYIYLITNTETKQFYVGQTVYNPVFRWAQHLQTARFPINNIINYRFELLEIVPKDKNIMEREKFWIQKKYNENPELSLNIMLVPKH